MRQAVSPVIATVLLLAIAVVPKIVLMLKTVQGKHEITEC